MPLISIKQYLDNFKPAKSANPALNLHAAACAMMLHEVDAHLLDSEAYARLKPQWGALAPMLDAFESPPDLEAFIAHLSSVLAERQLLEAEREQNQAHDVRHMLGVLNEALLSLAAGNDGSVDRLRRLEKALDRTSQLNDLVAMKASLIETMRVVREEVEQARSEGTGTLQRLDEQFEKARIASQRLPGLPGRAEAIRALELAVKPGSPPTLVVACQLERLRILRSRYGGPIADDLLMAFALSSAKDLADKAFRWSGEAVVFLCRTDEAANNKRKQLEEHFAQPFEYKVMASGRPALLSMPVRWLCASVVESGIISVTEEIDLFMKGQRWRP